MRRVTLSQFLVARQRDKVINADLRLLVETIARACKAISTRVNKGALGGGHGNAGNENVQGDAGRVVIMTDARGRSFHRVEEPSVPGANLVTTIDGNIQYIIET